MARLLQILAAAAAVGGLAGSSFALNPNMGSDEDGKETVETRLLKILKDRGVLKDAEFDELLQLGRQMREQELLTTSALDKEIRELADKIATQGDAKKAAPETKVSYKFGKGLNVAQGDNFSMGIGGRLQSRFSYISPDGLTSAGQDDRPTFDTRRVRISFDGFVFDKNLEYKIQFDTTPAASILRDAYFDYKFAPEFHLRSGQMKRPFSRQAWTSSGDLQVVERASTVERFRSLAGDRDAGLLAWGELGEAKTLEWYAGVFNGEGLNNGTPNAVALGTSSGGLGAANQSNNDSSGLEFVTRFVFNPNGPPGYSEGDLDKTEDAKLAFAIQYDFNPERRGNPLGIGGIAAPLLPTYDVHTVGGDFVMKYQGLFLTSEFYYREIVPTDRLNDGAGPNTSTETGWFAQAGYFFGEEKGKGPEFAMRYAQIDFDQNIAPATAFGGDTKIDDYTAAFSYYFAGHNLKLQAAYTYRVRNLRFLDANAEDQIFQIQAQVKL
ncbi:MAG: porin [Planctomycetota bacterium]